jgi:hypothetical protein
VSLAHVIEAVRLVTAAPSPWHWSSAWWQGGEVLERYDVVPHRDECPAGQHRLIAAGRGGSVARCAICGLRKAFVRLDALPRCSAMVKGRGFPMSKMRQCKSRAWAPGAKVCWTHLRQAEP